MVALSDGDNSMIIARRMANEACELMATQQYQSAIQILVQVLQLVLSGSTPAFSNSGIPLLDSSLDDGLSRQSHGDLSQQSRRQTTSSSSSYAVVVPDTSRSFGGVTAISILSRRTTRDSHRQATDLITPSTIPSASQDEEGQPQPDPQEVVQCYLYSDPVFIRHFEEHNESEEQQQQQSFLSTCQESKMNMTFIALVNLSLCNHLRAIQLEQQILLDLDLPVRSDNDEVDGDGDESTTRTSNDRGMLLDQQDEASMIMKFRNDAQAQYDRALQVYQHAFNGQGTTMVKSKVILGCVVMNNLALLHREKGDHETGDKVGQRLLSSLMVIVHRGDELNAYHPTCLHDMMKNVLYLRRQERNTDDSSSRVVQASAA